MRPSPPRCRTAVRIVLAVTAASLAGGAQAGDLPFYSALYARTAPRIDGVLDEACWRHAEQTAAFTQIGGAPADVPTHAMLCWDAHTLYVAFVCSEPLMSDLEARIARDDVGAFDESVELFLDPTRDRFSYLQLRVDMLGNRDTHQRNDPADELTDRWAGAAQRSTDGWTVEIAVSFSLLSAAPPQGSTLWGCNVNRQRLAHRGPPQWTCWSDTRGGFHSPDRFGCLVFTSYRPWLRQHFRERFAEYERQMGDLVLRYPEVAQTLSTDLQRLDREQAAFLEGVTSADLSREADCRALYDQGLALAEGYEKSLAQMRLTVIRDVLR